MFVQAFGSGRGGIWLSRLMAKRLRDSVPFVEDWLNPMTSLKPGILKPTDLSSSRLLGLRLEASP